MGSVVLTVATPVFEEENDTKEVTSTLSTVPMPPEPPFEKVAEADKVPRWYRPHPMAFSTGGKEFTTIEVGAHTRNVTDAVRGEPPLSKVTRTPTSLAPFTCAEEAVAVQSESVSAPEANEGRLNEHTAELDTKMFPKLARFLTALATTAVDTLLPVRGAVFTSSLPLAAYAKRPMYESLLTVRRPEACAPPRSSLTTPSTESANLIEYEFTMSFANNENMPSCTPTGVDALSVNVAVTRATLVPVTEAVDTPLFRPLVDIVSVPSTLEVTTAAV
jgi:hypothetical protein